jgi:general secretion pathway protein D
LKLRDGETQVLAGLLSRSERSSANKVPGVGELPLIGRLFGSTTDNSAKTEIVLSITPRLIRSTQRLEPSAEEFYSGTEANLRTRPLSLQPVKASQDSSMAMGDTASAPAAASSDQNSATVATLDGGDAPAPPEPEKVPTAVSVTWEAPSEAKVGDTIKVAMRLKSDGGLRSFPFQVGFNPDVLQFVDVKEGEFFRQGGSVTSFSQNVDNPKGRLLVGISRSGQRGAKGEDGLATVTFKVVGSTGQPDLKLLAASPVASVGASAAPSLPPALPLSISK